MNCKYLCGIEGFAEHVDGSQLTAEDSVGVCCLGGAEEAFIVALEEGHRQKTCIGWSNSISKFTNSLVGKTVIAQMRYILNFFLARNYVTIEKNIPICVVFVLTLTTP